MDKPATAALLEYRTAWTFLAVHLPSADAAFDLKIRERFCRADGEIERLGLRDTPAYADTVFAAARDADALSAQIGRAM
jgi:hypothetical protein